LKRLCLKSILHNEKDTRGFTIDPPAAGTFFFNRHFFAAKSLKNRLKTVIVRKNAANFGKIPVFANFFLTFWRGGGRVYSCESVCKFAVIRLTEEEE